MSEAGEIGKRFIHIDARDRPAETDFQRELVRLHRAAGGPGGSAVLAQLEYRWRNPDASSSLYAITLTLRAPEGTSLVAQGSKAVENGRLVEGAKLVKELRCTKIGETSFSVARRMETYADPNEPLGGVTVLAGSQNLRIVIYGEGALMPSQREMKEEAVRHGAARAWWVDEFGGVRPVGSETYVGVKIIRPLCAFVAERTGSCG
jgi:hypothetical protein